MTWKLRLLNTGTDTMYDFKTIFLKIQSFVNFVLLDLIFYSYFYNYVMVCYM